MELWEDRKENIFTFKGIAKKAILLFCKNPPRVNNMYKMLINVR
jgi:hypothetical protein